MAEKKFGTLYITAGYNLDWFSKSNIHFFDQTTDDYDFTLFKVEAKDRPGLKNVLHEDITIPQYSFRAGYWFNDRKDLGIEFNYDHAKYVMTQGQRVHMTGTFHGEYFDQDTTLISDFIRYEHTNGANYVMVNLLKRTAILHSSDEKSWLSLVVKAGAGMVVPRSDTWIAGHRRNDNYHVAGYVMGLDAGFRYDFYKYFFLESTMKGCFANYTNVILYGDGRASQHWWSLEYIFTLGIQAPVKLFR